MRTRVWVVNGLGKCDNRPAQIDGLKGLDLAHGILHGHLPSCLEPQQLLQILLGRHSYIGSLIAVEGTRSFGYLGRVLLNESSEVMTYVLRIL